MPLRIVNWTKYYETSESRKTAKLSWVATPNGHDSIAYRDLMAHQDGMAHYGAWNLILQVASRAPQRGLLVTGTGRAHTARTLALITGANIQLMEAAIKRLLEVGWLEDVTDISGQSPGPSGSSRESSGHVPTTVQDSTGQDKKAAAAAQPCKEEIANQAAAAASIDDLLEKPDKTAIIARRHTLGDLKQAFPVLITFRNDEDEARTMFDLWGWETLAQAIGILTPIARGRPAGKQRITVSELTQWLAAHGSLEAEDYKRAGLPVPENIK